MSGTTQVGERPVRARRSAAGPLWLELSAPVDKPTNGREAAGVEIPNDWSTISPRRPTPGRHWSAAGGSRCGMASRMCPPGLPDGRGERRAVRACTSAGPECEAIKPCDGSLLRGGATDSSDPDRWTIRRPSAHSDNVLLVGPNGRAGDPIGPWSPCVDASTFYGRLAGRVGGTHSCPGERQSSSLSVSRGHRNRPFGGGGVWPSRTSPVLWWQASITCPVPTQRACMVSKA